MALSVVLCSGHNRPIHEEIGVAAGLSSQGLTAYLQETIGPQNGPAPFVASPRLALNSTITLPSGDVFLMERGVPPATGFGPIEWLRLGST
jgi:hypothetical protein